jgi:hypothetical protein
LTPSQFTEVSAQVQHGIMHCIWQHKHMTANGFLHRGEACMHARMLLCDLRSVPQSIEVSVYSTHLTQVTISATRPTGKQNCKMPYCMLMHHHRTGLRRQHSTACKPAPTEKLLYAVEASTTSILVHRNTNHQKPKNKIYIKVSRTNHQNLKLSTCVTV